jgi:hypothetical protein
MKNTTNEAYYSLFCKWQESGQSKATFAASEGIPKATFYYWCKKFGTGSVSAASNLISSSACAEAICRI